MASCGLHVPCGSGSWFHFPGQIYVDIGDEQSIEQNLSTFSGHLKNIVGILKSVQPNDLVLFDEIGAGTDPDEGAALAKAVLRALSRRGAKVLATTHYGELKQFALSAGRFENASVEFDPQSLRPTYHLRIGVPGASNALDIAARLGMPPDLSGTGRGVIWDANALKSRPPRSNLDAHPAPTDPANRRNGQEREEVEKLRRDYENRLQKIERDKEKELERARREAREIVETASRDADAALRELRKAARGTAGGENKDTEIARGRLRTLRERVQASDSNGKATTDNARATEREEKAASRPHFPLVSPAPAPVEIKAGQIVHLKTLDREGEVLKIENNRAEVRVGAMKIEVKLADLEPTVKADQVRGVGGIQARKAWSVAPEINLIGMDTVSALDELEKYLDDAILAEKKEIRIVHGRGSGALRSAVHRFLKSSRAIEDYDLAPQNEGGEGATVAKLG